MIEILPLSNIDPNILIIDKEQQLFVDLAGCQLKVEDYDGCDGLPVKTSEIVKALRRKKFADLWKKYFKNHNLKFIVFKIEDVQLIY